MHQAARPRVPHDRRPAIAFHDPVGDSVGFDLKRIARLRNREGTLEASSRHELGTGPVGR